MSLLPTFANAMAGLYGMYSVGIGDLRSAVLSLVVALCFDLIDGPLARRSTRTKVQMLEGVIADSVADAVSFIALPALLLLFIGHFQFVFVVVAALYCLAGWYRLVHFTALAIKGETGDYFVGLPSVFVVPVVVLWFVTYGSELFLAIYMSIVAVLFVANFHIRKPHGARTYGIYALIVLLCLWGIVCR